MTTFDSAWADRQRAEWARLAAQGMYDPALEHDASRPCLCRRLQVHDRGANQYIWPSRRRSVADHLVNPFLQVAATAKVAISGCIARVSEVFIDHNPIGHAFVGERPRLTEAQVLEMAGVTPHGGAA